MKKRMARIEREERDGLVMYRVRLMAKSLPEHEAGTEGYIEERHLSKGAVREAAEYGFAYGLVWPQLISR